MGFGIGRSSNDTWMTVVSPRRNKTHSPYRVSPPFLASHNPYDVFHDEDFHNHHELELPNGEVVFSTYSSLEDLTTSLIHMYPYTKLVSFLKDNYEILTDNDQTINQKCPKNMLHTHNFYVNKTKINNHDQHNPIIQQKNDRNNNTNMSNLIALPEFFGSDQPLNTPPNKDSNNQYTQFFRTLSESTTNGNTMNISSTIQKYLAELDIDNVHQDLARSLCKRVGALSFVPFLAWLSYDTMDISEMREHLRLFLAKNKRDIEDNVEHRELLSYDDISHEKTKFKPETLAITQTDAIRQIIIDGYADMDIPFDPNTLDGKPRQDLIYSFYSALIDFEKAKKGPTFYDLAESISIDSNDFDSPKQSDPSTAHPASSDSIPNTITPLKRPLPETPPSGKTEQNIPMDTSHLPIDYTSELLQFTFVRIELMERNDMLPYLVFLSKKFKRPFRNGYFHNTSAREIREDLILYIMELHSHYTSSMITETTTKEQIESLEPFLAYNEYIIMCPSSNQTFAEILLKPIQLVKSEIIKQKIIDPRRLDSSFQQPGTQPSLNDDREQDINITSNDFITLTYDQILSFPSHTIMKYVVAFANHHNREVQDDFGQVMSLHEQQESLFFKAIEHRIQHTTPSLTSDLPDAIIQSWDRIVLFYEYYMFYHSHKVFDEKVFKNLEVTKICDDVIIARDSLLIKDDTDDQTNQCKIMKEQTPLVDSRTMNDVHMFYVTDTVITCEDQQELEMMFENTCQFHGNNQQLTQDDRDSDILSILGLLHSTDVPKLLDPTLQLFAATIQRAKMCPNDRDLNKMSKTDIHTILQEAIIHLNIVQITSDSSASLQITNLHDTNVHVLSKSQLQILLFRHYVQSDSEFRNTFGHTIDSLRNEVLNLIKDHNNMMSSSLPNETTSKPMSSLHTEQNSESLSSPTSSRMMSTQKRYPSGDIYITVTKDTKDLALEKMSTVNMIDEILRLTTDRSVTSETLNRKRGIELKNELQKLRDGLIIATVDQSKEFVITSTTDDNMIQQKNKEQLRFAINKFALDRNVLPDAQFINKMSKMQLIIEVKKARDVIKSGSKTIPIPILIKTKKGNKTKKELTQNLCGADITNFDAPKPVTNPKHDKDDSVSDPGFIAKSTNQEIITIHAKIETKQNNYHAPTIIKSFINEMRKGDSMLQIIPISKDDYSASEILDGSSSIPNDKQEMSKWITNIRTVKTKLHFTMRITTIDIDTIKSVIYAWCKGKGTWIDFTRLKATTKFFGGWFHKLSPYYHNIDHFAEYVYLRKPSLKNKLDIYQKQIYGWTDDGKKVITVGIVVDGDISVKDEAFKFLYEHKWSGRYRDISFIPYSTNEVLTKEDQLYLIRSNNQYQKSLARIIIKVRGARIQHVINNVSLSFQDWLFASTIGKKSLILGVEVISDEAVRFFFKSTDLTAVKNAIHNLYPKTVQKFGETLASQLVNEEHLQQAKSSNDIELAHASKLKTITGNPQGPSDNDDDSKPPERNSRCFFGESYVDVTKSQLTQTSDITQENENDDDLRSIVTKLTNNYNALKNSMSLSITTAVNNAISEQVAPIQKQVNEMKSDYDDKFEKFLAKSEIQDSKLDRILQILGGDTQAPSDATRSPGVGK